MTEPGVIPDLPLETDLRRLPAAHIVGRCRGQIASPLDGRYGRMDPARLRALVAELIEQADLDGVDVIVGIPEGGNIVGFAFAEAAGLPLVLATAQEPELPGLVTFTEPHMLASEQRKRIFGLEPGESVIIAEDEVTTGETVLDCVRNLRAAGIACDQVATVLAVDDGAMRAKLTAAGIRLHVARWLPADLLDRLVRES